MSRKVAHEEHGRDDEQHPGRPHLRSPAGRYGGRSAHAPVMRSRPVEAVGALAEVPLADLLCDVTLGLFVEGAHDVCDTDVAAGDEDSRDDEGDQRVDVVDDAHHLEVLRQRCAHRPTMQLDYTEHEQYEEVSDQGQRRQRYDGTLGNLRDTHGVPLERKTHGDVSFQRERNDVPHGQETADVHEIGEHLTPTSSVIERHSQFGAPRYQYEEQEGVIGDGEGCQVDVTRVAL